MTLILFKLLSFYWGNFYVICFNIFETFVMKLLWYLITCTSTSNMNNFLWLDFFTHKVIFLNQHKILRPIVYNMTTFENFDWPRPKQGQNFLKLHGILITKQKSDLVRNDLHTKLTPAPVVFMVHSFSKEHFQPYIWVVPSLFQEGTCSDLVFSRHCFLTSTRNHHHFFHRYWVN